MSDTISRQAAIDAIGKTSDELYENIKKGATFPQRQWFDGMAQAQSILENLPSAQPDIIRCRDCRYYQDNNNGYPHMNCKWDANETPDEDDFCSGAERRTDD